MSDESELTPESGRDQRARRIVWLVLGFTGFAVVAGVAGWVCWRTRWNPELVYPVFTLPYWAVVLSVWARYGPPIKGLGTARDPGGTGARTQ